MPTLAVNNFNIVLAVLGGWISLFGLVSYLCKENFYLSEACECQPPRAPLRRPRFCSLSLLASGHNINAPAEACFARADTIANSDITLGRGGVLSPCGQFCQTA